MGDHSLSLQKVMIPRETRQKKQAWNSYKTAISRQETETKAHVESKDHKKACIFTAQCLNDELTRIHFFRIMLSMKASVPPSKKELVLR
jgi:hypothetical protein